MQETERSSHAPEKRGLCLVKREEKLFIIINRLSKLISANAHEMGHGDMKYLECNKALHSQGPAPRRVPGILNSEKGRIIGLYLLVVYGQGLVVYWQI